MLKKILNALILIVLIPVLYFGYKAIFDIPNDPLELSELQINIGLFNSILLVLLFIRLHIDKIIK